MSVQLAAFQGVAIDLLEGWGGSAFRIAGEVAPTPPVTAARLASGAGDWA